MLPWSVSFSSRVRINFTFCNQIEFPLRPWRKNPTYLVTSRVEARRWSGKAPWSNICFDLVIRFKVRIQPRRTGNLRRRYVGPYMTIVKWRQIWKNAVVCFVRWRSLWLYWWTVLLPKLWNSVSGNHFKLFLCVKMSFTIDTRTVFHWGPQLSRH